MKDPFSRVGKGYPTSTVAGKGDLFMRNGVYSLRERDESFCLQLPGTGDGSRADGSL